VHQLNLARNNRKCQTHSGFEINRVLLLLLSSYLHLKRWNLLWKKKTRRFASNQLAVIWIPINPHERGDFQSITSPGALVPDPVTLHTCVCVFVPRCLSPRNEW